MADKDLAAALGYASDGGIVDALFGDVTIPARVNQNIARQGARTRARIQAQRQAQGPAFYDQAIPMEGRATFLPFRVSQTGQKSFAMPGLFAGAINAITAPGRALRGTDPTFNPEQEAFDVALNTMGMGGAVGRAPAGSLPMNVFHGSPHRFDRFDSSKIGTGEGAQAYGHGLYFAESPEVAKSYAPRDPNYEAKLLRMYQDMERRRNYDSMEVLESAMMHKTPSELRSQYGKAAEPVIKQIERIPQTKGGFYTVDLPDPAIARMLDWDKPVTDQSANDLLRSIGWNARSGSTRGTDLYGRMVDVLGDQAQAAAELRKAGITGIRYLDGGSRGYGAGTSNFVVFPGNEDLLTILERNGVPAQPTSVDYVDPFRDTTR